MNKYLGVGIASIKLNTLIRRCTQVAEGSALEKRHASTICKTRESLGIQGFRLNLKICFFHVFYPAFLSFFQACFYRLFRIE